MNKKKIIAGILVTSLIIENTALTNINVYAADISDNKKEEVVYIMTDAAGNVGSVNVVNIWGKGSITDYGDYSSVKMLTTTDTINQDGDKITFSTDNDKAYYQGTMKNTQIPWNISITYTLDGRKINPDDLAGKSGKLEIHLQITDNNLCNRNYFEDYALQLSLALDSGKCTNITADGATLANVGANKQISYTILPGKGLDAVVTANVTDFEMEAVSINGIKLNLNIEIDDAELMEKVTEIMDASKQLNTGASSLSDGTGRLNDAGGDLNKGVNKLYGATDTLNNGIGSLSDGITSMQSGLNTLNSKSSSLTDGSAQVKDALTTIQTSLANVSVSTEQLSRLTAGSSEIKKGIDELYNGAVALQNNFSYESYKAAMNQNGLDIDSLKAGNSSAIASLSEQLGALQQNLAQLKAAYPDYASNPALAGQVAELEGQVANLQNIITLLTGNNAAIQGTKTYLDTVSSGMDSLVNGLAELKTKYESFDAAIVTFANTLSGLAVNMSSLKGGIDQLLVNYDALDSGINQYTNGVAEIVAGYSKLVEGVGTLASGSKELLQGTGDLKQGTSDLYDGIISLCDGAQQLNNGTNEFYEKTSDMDTQVEDNIDEMIASISGDETETVSFASDKNTNISSVQFVIKTSEIKKADETTTEKTQSVKMNFWQKLLHLFGLY